MGKRRVAYSILRGRPYRRRHLGRPRSRWNDTIKMDTRKAGCDEAWTGSSGSGYGQVLGSGECGNEQSGFIKFWEFLE
jgi:hypothetical protein